ncbi:hypothetical protein Taro_036177 [Colocasia esculenta]|uniref:Uncharacterized protein n=1 Tax=Colocasia esculenta TaxID=4460 RepID=A0A843W8Y1_COLES|nr:hypothetical protein [Colocasia esculenta]
MLWSFSSEILAVLTPGGSCGMGTTRGRRSERGRTVDEEVLGVLRRLLPVDTSSSFQETCSHVWDSMSTHSQVVSTQSS